MGREARAAGEQQRGRGEGDPRVMWGRAVGLVEWRGKTCGQAGGRAGGEGRVWHHRQLRGRGGDGRGWVRGAKHVRRIVPSRPVPSLFPAHRCLPVKDHRYQPRPPHPSPLCKASPHPPWSCAAAFPPPGSDLDHHEGDGGPVVGFQLQARLAEGVGSGGVGGQRGHRGEAGEGAIKQHNVL